MTENTIVFDVETARPIRVDGEKVWPGIEYASGWEAYVEMGIACVCVFDFRERRFRVFDSHSLRDFRILMRDREKIVGWNNHKFDNPLLAAHGCHVDPACSFDLMSVFPQRVKLSDAAKVNGVQIGKSMAGAMAPIKWQQGEHAKVIDYCLHDVWITSALYSKWKKQGSLIDPHAKRAA